MSRLADRCKPPLPPLHPIALFSVFLGGWPFDYSQKRKAWQHSWICLRCDHTYSDLPEGQANGEKAFVSAWEADGNLPHWANKKHDGQSRKVVALRPPPPPVLAVKVSQIRPTVIHSTDRRSGEEAIEWPQASSNGHPEISVGMTMDAVRASSWGSPKSIDKSPTDTTGTEAWTYAEGRLIFEAGRITKIVFKKNV